MRDYSRAIGSTGGGCWASPYRSVHPEPSDVDTVRGGRAGLHSTRRGTLKIPGSRTLRGFSVDAGVMRRGADSTLHTQRSTFANRGLHTTRVLHGNRL